MCKCREIHIYVSQQKLKIKEYVFKSSFLLVCFKKDFYFMMETLKPSILQFCVPLTEVGATSYSIPQGKILKIYY